MEGKDFYRVMVVGPTEAGKSQFCNFIQRDLTNSINKISDDLNSCTKGPYSNIFARKNIKYEFRDTAESSNSSKDDINYISLLLKFEEE